MKVVTRVLLLVAVGGLATSGFGAIAGTDHDFSGRAWNSSGEICKPCHTPHNAQVEPNGDSMVLWNHALSGETFIMYSPLRSGRTIAGQPDGPSKLCLGCHDGVTAVDNYGGNGGSTEVIAGDHALGSDLRDDHPIGIVYDETVPDMNPIAGLSGVQLVEVGGVADRVECTSCHDPHGTANPKFLRLPLAGSQICLECHNK